MSYVLRILQSQLGDGASNTLLAMVEISDGALCAASQEEIAKARGVTRGSITRPMLQLQECGVIDKIRGGVYRIDISQLPMEQAEEPQADVADNNTDVVENNSSVVEDNSPVVENNSPVVEDIGSQPQKDPFPLPPFIPPSFPCIPNNPPIIPPTPIPQKGRSAWKLIFRAAYGDPFSDLPSDHPAVSARHLRYHMAADWSIKLMEKAEAAIESYRIPSAVRRKLDRDRHEVVQDYATTYRLLEEQDGYEWEEVRFGIHWLFTQSDWLRDGYIASVNALRRKTRSGDRTKFDVILTQAKADNDYEGPNSKAEVSSKTDRKQRGKRDDESLEERYQRNYEAALRAVSA